MSSVKRNQLLSGALLRALIDIQEVHFKMKKVIAACVTLAVAVGAGIWFYKYWRKRGSDKNSISEDEVSKLLSNEKKKVRQKVIG